MHRKDSIRPNYGVCYDVSHLHRLGNKLSRQRDQLSRMSPQRVQPVATTGRFPSDEGYDHTDDRVVEQVHYETAGIATINNQLRSKMARSRNVASDNGTYYIGSMAHGRRQVTGDRHVF